MKLTTEIPIRVSDEAELCDTGKSKPTHCSRSVVAEVTLDMETRTLTIEFPGESFRESRIPSGALKFRFTPIDE